MCRGRLGALFDSRRMQGRAEPEPVYKAGAQASDTGPKRFISTGEAENIVGRVRPNECVEGLLEHSVRGRLNLSPQVDERDMLIWTTARDAPRILRTTRTSTDCCIPRARRGEVTASAKRLPRRQLVEGIASGGVPASYCVERRGTDPASHVFLTR